MDIIAVLTVAALLVGLVDGIMTLVLLHRQDVDEDRLTRDELRLALDEKALGIDHDLVADKLAHRLHQLQQEQYPQHDGITRVSEQEQHDGFGGIA